MNFVYTYFAAVMAELVDALDSDSSEVTLMEVQILLAAPKNANCDNTIILSIMSAKLSLFCLIAIALDCRDSRFKETNKV